MDVVKLPKKVRMVCYEIMDGREEALDTLESFADKYPHQITAVKAEVAYRDAIARYLYLGEREKALQTAERLATSRLWAVAGPTQVRPMSFFEDPNLREFLLEPESLRRIREAAFIDDGSLIRK